MAVPRCPKCGVEVGTTWRWCLACGYDPDGSALRVRQAAIERRQQQNGWLPVVIVMAGLLVGGLILWWSTPGEEDRETAGTPSAGYEVTSWESFTPPSGGFTVDLPVVPESRPPDAPMSTAGQLIEDYVADSGPLHFRALVVDTTATGAPVSDELETPLLDLFATELAQGYQGRLERPRKVDVGRHPGNEFTIYDGSVGDLRGKAVLVGRYLYVLVVTGENLPDASVRHFFDSLTVN